jgi:hypothetical protein
VIAPAASALDERELDAGLQRLHDQARGRFMLEILRPRDLAAAIAAAEAGDTGATRSVFAVADFINRCAAARTLCLHGPRPLTGRPGAVVLLRPARARDAREAAWFGFCRGCAGGRTDRALGELALAALRGIWSDLREIVLAEGGHA